MKGISVVLTILLLVAATELANQLRRKGKLPADTVRNTPAMVDYAKGAANQRTIRL